MKKNNSHIPLFKVYMSKGVMNPLSRVLQSGYIGQGSQVEKFEKKLSQFLGVPWVLTVNSGTSALSLALHLAGVGPGDEVISTPMTCTATNWPILSHGASIVWADIDPRTGNIDPKSIKKCITKKTKAIMIVDWGGYPCDVDAIRKISRAIPIIEDAAHGFGALYKGKMVGQSADFTCFSFQAIKHLTAGDGGALVTARQEDYRRGKLLRWYGIDRETRTQFDRIEVDVKESGYKFHMNDINATIGLGNFKKVPWILKKHRAHAAYYRKHLVGLDYVHLTHESKHLISSYWLFTLLVDSSLHFITHMSTHGIMASQVHRRNDTHPVVKAFQKKLPGVDQFSQSMVCIPVGWWLSARDKSIIVKAIRDYDSLVPRT